MAIDAPITGAPLRAPAINRIEAEFALANRGAIEAEVERLIALLDATDGDPDLEPDDDLCLAGDDGCGYHHAGGLSGWGSRDESMSLAPPRYALDQSLGPVNVREVERAYYRELHSLETRL